MSTANSTGNEHGDVAPILRALFPELSEAELYEAHAEFAHFLGLLFDDWARERRVRASLTAEADVLAL